MASIPDDKWQCANCKGIYPIDEEDEDDSLCSDCILFFQGPDAYICPDCLDEAIEDTPNLKGRGSREDRGEARVHQGERCRQTDHTLKGDDGGVRAAHHGVTMKLRCQRCKHEWNYTGKNKLVAPYSKCKTSLSIRMNKVVSS